MRDLRIRFSDEAISDLNSIHEFVSQYDPSAAAKIGAVIEQSLLLLSLFPEKSRKVRKRGWRALPLGRYPYIIFFRISGDDLEVLRILHGAQRHPGFMEEATAFAT